MTGGSQAASRSLQGISTPDANSTKFFGFFAVSGKFVSVFGPLIYGILIAITGSVQSGILSALLFFIVGMAILWTVNEEKRVQEKQKPVISFLFCLLQFFFFGQVDFFWKAFYVYRQNLDK